MRSLLSLRLPLCREPHSYSLVDPIGLSGLSARRCYRRFRRPRNHRSNRFGALLALRHLRSAHRHGSNTKEFRGNVKSLDFTFYGNYHPVMLLTAREFCVLLGDGLGDWNLNADDWVEFKEGRVNFRRYDDGERLFSMRPTMEMLLVFSIVQQNRKAVA